MDAPTPRPNLQSLTTITLQELKALPQAEARKAIKTDPIAWFELARADALKHHPKSKRVAFGISRFFAGVLMAINLTVWQDRYPLKRERDLARFCQHLLHKSFSEPVRLMYADETYVVREDYDDVPLLVILS